MVDRIGEPEAKLTFEDQTGHRQAASAAPRTLTGRQRDLLIDWLEEAGGVRIGRGRGAPRGARHEGTPSRSASPRPCSTSCADLGPYDPDHLPGEIELIVAFRDRHPKLPQVACFDTAFHRTMPRVAKMTPPPPLRRERGAAIRLPWPVVHVPHGGARPCGGPGGGRRAAWFWLTWEVERAWRRCATGRA